MIDCTENQDGTFTISWDENDPLESVLNDWTEKDFIEVIQNYAEEILAAQEFYGKNSSKSREESRETNISEATQKDWEDFWYNSESEGKDYPPIEKGYPTKDDRLWEG